VLGAEKEETLLEPPTPFGLDMKKIRVQIDKLSKVKEIEEWIINECNQLIIQLSQNLLDAFTPSPQLQYVKGDRPFFEYSIKNEIDDLNVSLSAKSSHQDPEICSLSVDIGIPSRDGWPHLGGIEIMLKENVDDINALAVQKTDAHGIAVFKQIERSKLPDIVVQIDESP